MMAARGAPALALLLAACSQAPSGEAEQAGRTTDGRAGSDVGVTAAPDQAVTYRYAFRVPIQAIAAAQEKHAADCEALGPARCRITGMRYAVSGNRAIEAGLELRLEPAIARRFGRDAIAATVAQGGMLTSAEITTEDLAAVRAGAPVPTTPDQQMIDSQLARTDIARGERTALNRQRAAVGEQARREALSRLARTPMTISYESGPVDPGFADGPIRGALRDGWAAIVAGTGVLLWLAIAGLPWVVALAGVALVARMIRRRLDRRSRHED